MANKYWVANQPDSNISAEEAKDLAQLAKDVSVGVDDAGTGSGAAGEDDVEATKVLKVNINGTAYWIPCYIANGS